MASATSAPIRFPLPSRRTLTTWDGERVRTFEIPLDAEQVREDWQDGRLTGMRYRAIVQLEGPPAPCRLVDPACTDEYCRDCPRWDLLTVTHWESCPEASA